MTVCPKCKREDEIRRAEFEAEKNLAKKGSSRLRLSPTSAI